MCFIVDDFNFYLFTQQYDGHYNFGSWRRTVRLLNKLWSGRMRKVNREEYFFPSSFLLLLCCVVCFVIYL